MSHISKTLRVPALLRPLRNHVGHSVINSLYHNGKHIPPHRIYRLLRSPGRMTWSQIRSVRTQCRLLQNTSQRSYEDENIAEQNTTRIPEPWETPLTLKDPEFDLEFILNPQNYQLIKENISHRKDPEFDLEFILNPQNYQLIKENISHRKGVGNIDTVLNLHKKMTEENNKLASLLETSRKVRQIEPDIKEKIYREFIKAAWDLPNMSHPESPIGDEDNATLIDVVGQKPDMNFEPKTMLELGEQLGMLRTHNVTMTTGHTTYYFIDQLALLEQALIQYTLKYLLEKGFELISVPDLLKPQIIESCGFKTTGEVTQVYRLDPRRHKDLCLAGTSEMSIAGYFANKVLDKKILPVRFAAVSRCYRAEVSHLEPDIYRVHQFTKVEMFGVTSNDSSTEGNDLLQEFIDIERNLFTGLGLHYRVLDMPTTELGSPAHRKFDIEAWMPARRFWGEISSASNCTDYQSRRLNIKYVTNNRTLKHCTTVNGTACAIPRTIMTLCENNQLEDGSIALPKVLHQYMDGQEKITKPTQPPLMDFIEVQKINYKK